MSYSFLGSALLRPQRSFSSAKKATVGVTLSKSAINTSLLKPKTTLVVGSNLKPPPPPPLVPPPPIIGGDKPPANDKPPPADDAWADWGAPVDTAQAPSETSDAQQDFSEPSTVEPLVPESKPFPWAWVALGLTATAFLGYAVFKRPMKPNRRKRAVRANMRKRRSRDPEAQLATQELREGRRIEREWDVLHRQLIDAGLDEEHRSVTKDLNRLQAELTRALQVDRTGRDSYGKKAVRPTASYLADLRRKIADFRDALREIENEARSLARPKARRRSRKSSPISTWRP